MNIKIPRLMMLTYEPSYYATLLVPLFAFYFVKFILKQIETNAFLILSMIAVPLILSLSFGVISGLAISISILFLINFARFLSSKKLFYSVSIIALSIFIILILLLIFYKDNPIFGRMIAFVGGDDQSGRARTSEAFQLGYEI